MPLNATPTTMLQSFPSTSAKPPSHLAMLIAPAPRLCPAAATIFSTSFSTSASQPSPPVPLIAQLPPISSESKVFHPMPMHLSSLSLGEAKCYASNAMPMKCKSNIELTPPSLPLFSASSFPPSSSSSPLSSPSALLDFHTLLHS